MLVCIHRVDDNNTTKFSLFSKINTLQLVGPILLPPNLPLFGMTALSCGLWVPCFILKKKI